MNQKFRGAVLGLIVFQGLTLSTRVCAQPTVPEHPVPTLPPDWHWVAPDGSKHPFTVRDHGKGFISVTDHAGQTGAGCYNARENRFDLTDGRLAGVAFYQPELKRLILVTKNSYAVYTEGRVSPQAPSAPRPRSSRLEGESPGSFK